jgi:hypothetical protein
MNRLASAVISVASLTGGAHVADSAARAPYATPEELAPEGLPHQVEVSLGGRYTRVLDSNGSDSPSGLRNIETFDLASRLLIGRSLAYSAGLDAHVGGSDTGAAYGATLYPVGIGLRGERGTFVSLSGGVGVDRVVGSVPIGTLFPAELAVAFPLGPLRPMAWVRGTWIAGAPERRHGSTLTSAVDELEAALAIRIGKQQRYWMEMNAGGGPSIGVFYREFMGVRALGVMLSVDFSGGQ